MGLLSKLHHRSKSEEAAAEKEKGSSSVGSAPPAYSSGDAAYPAVTDDAPEYLRPRLPNQGSAMNVMPPSFNVYASWKSMSKLHIGSSAEEKQYLVVCTQGWSRSKPVVTIYNGLSADDVPFVHVSPPKWKLSEDCTITVPSRQSPAGPPFRVDVAYKAQSWRDWNFTFSMPISTRATNGELQPPQEHTFQWRNTSGSEVKLLDDGSRFASGWKLIWTTGPEHGDGMGFGGDGREVVAVAARSSKSITKVVRFVYMGTGLTGVLGYDWELVAAASALQLWWHDLNAAAAGTAA